MKNIKRYGVVIILICLVITALVGAGIYAKYVKSVSISGSVMFSADLADDIKLIEYKAVHSPDGGYKLSETETVQENSYSLMPGVNIPKDPQIVITGKSALAAYLYVEIVDNTPSSISYSLTENWQKLDGIIGKHNGTLYVYTENNTPILLNDEFTESSIKILKSDNEGNTIVVSDSFTSNESFSLKFYAYMAQVVDDKTPEEVFTYSF